MSQVNLLGLAAVLAALASVVFGLVGPWRVRRDQLVLPLFALVQVLFIVSFPVMVLPNERLMSAARHVLEIFPMFLVFAIAGRSALVNRLYLGAGLTLQGFLIGYYLRNGWIA
jgi:hypothetical protein